MPALQIGPVRDEDLETTRHLAMRSLGTTVPGPFLAALARERRDRFRVARDSEGNVRGFAVAARQPGAKAHVFLVAVDPDDHGRGIRKALLADIERVLRADQEKGIVVDVAANDVATTRLLRGQGFRVTGTERDPMGAERLVLAKRFAPVVPPTLSVRLQEPRVTNG